MARDSKVQKRKAPTPAAAEAPQTKKSKKFKPEPQQDTQEAKPARLTRSILKAPKSVDPVNKNGNKAQTSQAVDAVSDDDNDGGVALKAVAPLNQPQADKPEKTKTKEKKAAAAGNAEKPESGSAKQVKALPARKGKGPSTVNLHAEKIKQLLGQTDKVSKPTKTSTKSKLNLNSNEKHLENGTDGAPASSTKAKKRKNVANDDPEETEDNDDEDIEVAKNLLKGFDSDTEDPAEDEGLDAGQAVAGLPHYKKTQKKLRQAKLKGGKNGPGVVYVGRVPHGFYEDEMRLYFTQFGTITKLRLSRNRQTGHSKHFAFIEFESVEVAKIVAETMDNYLMFGHILKCKFVESEALHPDTFKGANKRFRVIPHTKIERMALDAPKTESQWSQKNDNEQAKRLKKAEKMKDMGYEFDLPELKAPHDVLRKQTLPINGENGTKELGESGRETEREEKTKTQQENKPGDAESLAIPRPEEVQLEAEPVRPSDETADKKQKKTKKTKGKPGNAENLATSQPEEAQPEAEPVQPSDETADKKQKNTKKTKKTKEKSGDAESLAIPVPEEVQPEAKTAENNQKKTKKTKEKTADIAKDGVDVDDQTEQSNQTKKPKKAKKSKKGKVVDSSAD